MKKIVLIICLVVIVIVLIGGLLIYSNDSKSIKIIKKHLDHDFDYDLCVGITHTLDSIGRHITYKETKKGTRTSDFSLVMMTKGDVLDGVILSIKGDRKFFSRELDKDVFPVFEEIYKKYGGYFSYIESVQEDVSSVILEGCFLGPDIVYNYMNYASLPRAKGFSYYDLGKPKTDFNVDFITTGEEKSEKKIIKTYSRNKHLKSNHSLFYTADKYMSSLHLKLGFFRLTIASSKPKITQALKKREENNEILLKKLREKYKNK
jgi:hypothetical protein